MCSFFFSFTREINPDVEFEVYNYNITTMENFNHFMGRIRWELELFLYKHRPDTKSGEKIWIYRKKSEFDDQKQHFYIKIFTKVKAQKIWILSQVISVKFVWKNSKGSHRMHCCYQVLSNAGWKGFLIWTETVKVLICFKSKMVLNLYISHLPTFCVPRHGGKEKDTPVDLVLSCVDNFEARMAINTVSPCSNLQLNWQKRSCFFFLCLFESWRELFNLLLVILCGWTNSLQLCLILLPFFL